MPMLRLRDSTLKALKYWAATHPTVEVCGLVWGTQTFQTVHPLSNVHPVPDKYFRTAPKDVRDAFTRMDEEGGKPLAWYHSHPSGKHDPSETDMEGAMDPGMHYLIVYPKAAYPAPSHWEVSVWECLQPGVLVEAEYVVE